MGKVLKLQPHSRAKRSKETEPRYLLRLYTTGSTSRSTTAIRNLQEICEKLLKGRYRLEVIDIYQEPGRASEADIIAAPTLIKYEPLPKQRVVGDMSNHDKVVSTLAIAGARK